jgi:argininosuccinate lyase
MLVRKYNVAFRSAHKIAGAVVKALIDSHKTLLDATPELLSKVAEESTGLTLMVKNEDIVSCTNPRKLVETYKVQGGPSPTEVQRGLYARQKTMAKNRKVVDKLQEQQSNAQTALNSKVEAYSLSNSQESVKLKKLN